jgi:hypothetical protein
VRKEIVQSTDTRPNDEPDDTVRIIKAQLNTWRGVLSLMTDLDCADLGKAGADGWRMTLEANLVGLALNVRSDGYA